MTLRSAIVLCAVIAGLSGLTLCRPPTPRIARVETPSFPIANSAVTKDILAASNQIERVIQAHKPDSPLTRDVVPSVESTRIFRHPDC